MAFKMKGDPMGRNFGVGPLTKKTPYEKNTGDPVPGADSDTEEGKQALIDNAIGTATKTTLSDTTVGGMKKHFGGVNADLDDVKLAIRKARAIEGNSDHVLDMQKIAKSRYPDQFR